MTNLRGYRASRVVTCDPKIANGSNELGVIENGVVVIDDAKVAFVGKESDAPPVRNWTDCGERVITPGLIDAHTHACWAGSRHDEYVARMAGGDYRAIAAAGGGILSTHRAVMAASEDELVHQLTGRLSRMLHLGVTTCEVKSGYGLLAEAELKQLRAIKRASEMPNLPHIVPTFLALHAVPPGLDRDQYAASVVNETLPAVAREQLAQFVDAYIDANAFTAEQGRAIATAARAHGLGIRMHVGQFADVGGAELCADFSAASADHLEHIGDAGIERLAAAKTHAVLLPTASFLLRQAPPPIDKLRAAGIALVVASDANPGTAPTESLPLAMALAVRLYGLTPAEAILGATRNAANALRLGDRGVLASGNIADLCVWELPHEFAILQPWGVSRTERVVCSGIEDRF